MRYLVASLLLSLSFGLVIAGGGGTPRREDMPKYIQTIKSSSASLKAKTEAIDMIGKRGAVNAKDVDDAVEPLRTLARKDKDAGVRKAAVNALGNIAPEALETSAAAHSSAQE